MPPLLLRHSLRKEKKKGDRKGRAFPHCAAASRKNSTPGKKRKADGRG
jgi:hypothetical protein